MLTTLGDAIRPAFRGRRLASLFAVLPGTRLQPNGVQSFGGQVFGIPRSVWDDYGVFANFVVPTADNALIFTVGGRMDFTRSFLDTLDPVVTSAGGVNPYSPGFAQPSNQLGMLYGRTEARLTDNLSANAGMAYAMRNPSLAELYSNDPFVPLVRWGNSVSRGNSVLNPERAWHFDLGVNGNWERLSGGARASTPASTITFSIRRNST